MSKNILVGIVILAAGAGAITGVGLLGGDEPGDTTDGGTAVVYTVPEKRIEDVAPVAVTSSISGKKVFVVGEARPEAAVVVDSDLGQVVVKNTISERALCNVVFEAKVKVVETTSPMGQKIKTEQPDFPVLFGHVQPVKLQGSCVGDSCLYNTLLHGNQCLLAVDAPGYIGSTMNEFISLPLAMQARFLMTEGLCLAPRGFGRDEEKEVPCTVHVGDLKATKNAKIFFSHNWAGRSDIAPLEATWNGEKYVAEDRAAKEMESKGKTK